MRSIIKAPYENGERLLHILIINPMTSRMVKMITVHADRFFEGETNNEAYNITLHTHLYNPHINLMTVKPIKTMIIKNQKLPILCPHSNNALKPNIRNSEKK